MKWYDWILAPPAFKPDDEEDYLHLWRMPQALHLQRFAGWIAVAMYAGGVAADAWVGHRLTNPWVFWLFGISGVSMGALLTLVTYPPRLRVWAHDIAVITLLINGCALIAVTALTQQGGDPFPHFWTLVLVTYTFVMTGMPYRRCAPLGIGLVLLDIAVGIWLGLPASTLSDRILLDVSMLLTGLIACSNLERSDRLGWMRAQLMQAQSHCDELTGLRNRRYLFEEGAHRIEHAGREDLPIALLMIDVDYFKRYNDSLGHPAGDRCLSAVAVTLKGCAHHPLDIVTRLGGEEFAVLLFACNQLAALREAEVLRGQLQALAIPHPDAPLGCVTVSIGVAATDASGRVDLESLLLVADKALYRAKQGSRNSVSG